jgi:hypothetical protein
MAAFLTVGARKTVSQDAAFEVGTQLPLGVGGDTPSLPVLVAQGKEGLEMVLYLSTMRSVSRAPWRWNSGAASHLVSAPSFRNVRCPGC